MKKTLVLMRHAETNAFVPGREDYMRELTDFGHSQAKKVGQDLKKGGWNIQALHSSDAIRAAQTSKHVSEEIGLEVKFEKKLYTSSMNHLAEVISRTNDEVEALMLVGHNPVISDFVMKLSNEPAMMNPSQCFVFSAEIETWANFDVRPWDILANYSG